MRPCRRRTGDILASAPMAAADHLVAAHGAAPGRTVQAILTSVSEPLPSGTQRAVAVDDPTCRAATAPHVRWRNRPAALLRPPALNWARSRGYSRRPVRSNRLSRVDLPPSVFPNTATRLMAVLRESLAAQGVCKARQLKVRRMTLRETDQLNCRNDRGPGAGGAACRLDSALLGCRKTTQQR